MKVCMKTMIMIVIYNNDHDNNDKNDNKDK